MSIITIDHKRAVQRAQAALQFAVITMERNNVDLPATLDGLKQAREELVDAFGELRIDKKDIE